MDNTLTSALHTKLNSTKPIAVIDIESTGVNPSEARIVEITIAKVNLDGTVEVKTKRFNPEMPIPADATEVHGITDADVANEPPFKKVAKAMASFINGCELAGFASNRFDIPLLYAEFVRAGVVVDLSTTNFLDASHIFIRKEGRTLGDAYRYYCGKELVGAHGSQADALATLEVLEAQLDKYPDLPKDVAALNRYGNYDNERLDVAGKLTRDKDGDIVTTFGTNKGKKLKNEPGFCKWILEHNFPPDVNEIVTNILNA